MRTRTFPLSGTINLHARLGHGSLTVTAQDDLAEASVTMTPRGSGDIAERITIEMNGPTLTVVAPRQGGVADLLNSWRRESDGVDVEIVVPTGTALKIATFTADITVQGRCGGADIATAAGSIDLDEVDGDLRLRYGTATSRVRLVHGSAIVRSGSGHAHFGEVDGDLRSGFGSGDLEVATVHGTVRSRAGSGEARLGAVFGDVDVASGTGDVSIGLPTGVSARLDIKTSNGNFRSDLAVEHDRTGSGPAITVRTRTGSGDVRLFSAA